MTKVRARLSPHRVGFAMLAAVVGVFMATVGTALAATSGSSNGTAGMTGMTGDQVGTTPGWFDGKTVTFKYTKNFFCAEPPSAAVKTHCEVGAQWTTKPNGPIGSPLYVIVPLFGTPSNKYTLQCPTAGGCIDHPSSLDLSRVFGDTAKAVPLPPHSHIIFDKEMNQPIWWPIQVVGVTNQAAWDKIVAGKNLATVKMLQKNQDPNNPDVTGFIHSNLFLFFQVLPQSAS